MTTIYLIYINLSNIEMDWTIVGIVLGLLVLFSAVIAPIAYILINRKKSDPPEGTGGNSEVSNTTDSATSENSEVSNTTESATSENSEVSNTTESATSENSEESHNGSTHYFVIDFPENTYQGNHGRYHMGDVWAPGVANGGILLNTNITADGNEDALRKSCTSTLCSNRVLIYGNDSSTCACDNYSLGELINKNMSMVLLVVRQGLTVHRTVLDLKAGHYAHDPISSLASFIFEVGDSIFLEVFALNLKVTLYQLAMLFEIR